VRAEVRASSGAVLGSCAIEYELRWEREQTAEACMHKHKYNANRLRLRSILRHPIANVDTRNPRSRFNPPPKLNRVPLSPEASCLSFGAFLQTCFSASALEVDGHSLHSGFVKYCGLGRTVMCIHQVGAWAWLSLA